jgi:hypothetical protein
MKLENATECVRKALSKLEHPQQPQIMSIREPDQPSVQ